MPRFRLTADIIAANAAAPVVCIDERAIGRTYTLHVKRPGRTRALLVSEFAESVESVDQIEAPAIARVDISGVLEQRAGYHDVCGGYSDGYDAIYERMEEAFEAGDVLMVFDSPGGSYAGLQEGVRRIVECKQRYGRRVTGYVDELCCSAAYWLAASVCDEIFAPAAGVIGSIGARSAHQSVAGALEREGVQVTYFVWPGMGKVAQAPEMPLSDVGRSRGERDVSLAGEAFASAMLTARGLSRDAIVALDADALSGQAAIDANLIDGIATLEDTISYCLQMAEGVHQENMETLRAEEDPEMSETDDPEMSETDDPQMGSEPDHICDNCGMQNEADAKYCDQCGQSMDAKPMPSAEGPCDPPKSTIRGALGLRENASDLAVKTAVLAMRNTLDQCRKLTASSSDAALIGAVRAHADDAKRVGELEGKVKAMTGTAAKRERNDLLLKLAAAGLPGYLRGDLFTDAVVDGKKVSSPSAMFATTPLPTLREFVSKKLAGGIKTRATPFEPSEKAARLGHADKNIVDRVADTSYLSREKIEASAAALEAEWNKQ